jgi:hypothetical protein
MPWRRNVLNASNLTDISSAWASTRHEHLATVARIMDGDAFHKVES